VFAHFLVKYFKDTQKEISEARLLNGLVKNRAGAALRWLYWIIIAQILVDRNSEAKNVYVKKEGLTLHQWQWQFY
jgi:hypothetical protein